MTIRLKQIEVIPQASGPSRFRFTFGDDAVVWFTPEELQKAPALRLAVESLADLFFSMTPLTREQVTTTLELARQRDAKDKESGA
jgi:hypothetical protein